MPDSADEFVRANIDALRRFAYVVCCSAHEADELAQIAVIEVWRRWNKARGNPQAYARRVIVTRNVSRWRRRRWETPSEYVDVQMGDPARYRVTNPILWDALLALPHRDRVVVVLHVLYEYTFAEIAELIGEPRGTVSSRYTRAKRDLQKKLREPTAAGLTRLVEVTI